MLAIVIALLAQVSTPLEAKSPGNLGEELYYAGSFASGSKLCNRDQAAQYARQFRSRYGERICALISYHERQTGPDPSFIYTSDCLRLQGSRHEQDRAHALAMDRFEKTLRALERRYGPQEAGQANSS